MFLAILGGLLLATCLAQVAVLVMSFLYKDQNGWFLVPSAVVIIAILAVQGAATGIWSVALISAIPQLIFLGSVWFGGVVVYETSNPLRIGAAVIKGEWAVSKLAGRFKTMWGDTIQSIKDSYYRGYHSIVAD